MEKDREHIVLLQAETEPIKIDLLKSAVIVVDMQNCFVRKGGYFDLAGNDISAAQKIIEPCKHVITSMRKKGSKILYLQMGCSSDLSDAAAADSPSSHKSGGLVMIKQRPELRDKVYIYGTWGADIIEELKPLQEDIIVRKQRYDGFFGTNLDIILRTLGVRNLLFIGIATNVCVESTIRHAFFLDYFPILVSDAVSQMGSDITQQATILNVQSAFGWVTSSENLLNAIHNLNK
ncbi:MAG: isochorismatase family protein [Desulfobacteraceae bacterium]|nr:isochorismatase family protein [Desulfobacteraceae bacterium]